MGRFGGSDDTTVKALKPELFDKRLLHGNGYKQYIYEINFSGRKMRDLKAEGYIHAVYPYLDEVEMDLVKFEESSVGTTKPYRVAVVRCKLTLGFRMGEAQHEHKFTVTAYGDGDTREVKDPTALVRIVETRALKRAIARALDISRSDFDEHADVEEVGTPIQDQGSEAKNPLAQKLEESREKIRQMQAKGSPVTEMGASGSGGSTSVEDESDW